MTRARLTFIVSALGIVFSLLGILANEGILTSWDTRNMSSDREIPFPSIHVWRSGCHEPPARARRMSVVASSPPGVAGYLSSSADGLIRIEFRALFKGCSSFGVDLSELGRGRLLKAQYRLFDSVPGRKRRRTLGRLEPATVIERDPGRYDVLVPAGRQVASLELDVAELFERVGLAELELAARVAIRSAPSSDSNLIGARLATVVAIDRSQRQSVPNTAGPFSEAQAVTTIWSEDLDSMNRLLSILLSTLLGVCVGGVFEALLVVETVREVRLATTSDPASNALYAAAHPASIPEPTTPPPDVAAPGPADGGGVTPSSVTETADPGAQASPPRERPS